MLRNKYIYTDHCTLALNFHKKNKLSILKPSPNANNTPILLQTLVLKFKY